MFTLSGCATTITSARYLDSYNVKRLGDGGALEYIGLKIDNRILSVQGSVQAGNGLTMSEFDIAKKIAGSENLSKFGHTLEAGGLALDKSYAYFGVYELQELEVYKNTNRYVTFVEVEKTSFKWKDNASSQSVWGITGGTFLGCGAAYAILGGVLKNSDETLGKVFGGIGYGAVGVGALCLIPSLPASKTTTTFEGVYNIYIYDTVKKALVRKETVSIKHEEVFRGSFSKDDGSRQVVYDFYSLLIRNALLAKYEDLYNWVTYTLK